MIDKIYYDSSLVNAIVKSPSIYLNLSFIYKNLTFNKIDSIFYFVNEIKFIGGMWSNIYEL